jgi:hypothetical protein
VNFIDFQTRLQEQLILELTDWQPKFVSETMRAFDFGCHPWHGYIELSFLTTDETDEISSDSIWETVGDWRLYDFAPPNAGYERFNDLGEWMKSYGQADKFFSLFASVLMSKEVINVLQKYNLSSDFQIGVVNPDDPNHFNYCDGWNKLINNL